MRHETEFLWTVLSVLALVSVSVRAPAADNTPDGRDIRNGHEIPDEDYCDQPYIVTTGDGTWVCTLTTGPGDEGAGGQHMVATRSTDHGKTWSDLVELEPSSGPKASYGVPLITDYGRLFVFYNYNGDHVNETPQGTKVQGDELGWYCYRYSDDKGNTWSRRYRLDLPVTAVDRVNEWGGTVQMFWGICKPITTDGDVYWSFTKLGKYSHRQGEGWLYHSPNILYEEDVDEVKFQLLPAGDRGIRHDKFGSVQTEHNIAWLGGDDLYCVYRTTTGHPCHAYSYDGGSTWTLPTYMTYTPGGRPLKTARACPRVWRAENGKYLFWFHNYGGHSWEGRNPVWISGGLEKDGKMYWSEPEILLYHPDRDILGMSYPDLIEEEGKYWFSETQKSVARVHRVDGSLLEGLWSQGSVRTAARDGLALSLEGGQLEEDEVAMPPLPDLSEGGGFSVDMWVRFDNLEPDQGILDSRTDDGQGIVLRTTDRSTVELVMNDGTREATWDCDPGTLEEDAWNHVVFIVDGNPCVVSVVVNGRLCDGGAHRKRGWSRLERELGNVTGGQRVEIAPSLDGELGGLRVYNRYLRTSEAIANYNAGAESFEGRSITGVTVAGQK